MATLLLLSFYYFFESNLFATLRISYTFVLILMTGFYLFIFPEQWINHLALIAIPGLLIAMIYPRWAIRLRFNVLYLILAIIFVFSAETWLRENKPFEIGRWGEYPALQKDDRTVYSLIPDKTTHLRYNNYDYVLKTNSLGFNSPEINLKQQKDTNTFRIFVVGDAFSMPEGVEYKKSYPRLLEDKLKKSHPNKSIQVINGGVTGYGPTEMLLQMQTYIDTINPDLIINQIFVNEFAEINYSSKSRLRNIGFRDYSLKEKLFWYSQLSEHIKKNLRDILHQPDLNHYENKSLLFFYNKDSRYYNDTIIDKMDHYLESIKTISRESNSTLLIMYVPGEIEVSKPDHIDYYPHHLNIQDTTKYDLSRPNEIIRRLCRRNDIRLFDTEKILSEHPDQPVYYPRSWHWNAEGHKLIARELTKRINND
jgi:lysophospholipase L1-like esterase